MATFSVESYHDEGDCEYCGEPFTQNNYEGTVSCLCFDEGDDDE